MSYKNIIEKIEAIKEERKILKIEKYKTKVQKYNIVIESLTAEQKLDLKVKEVNKKTNSDSVKEKNKIKKTKPEKTLNKRIAPIETDVIVVNGVNFDKKSPLNTKPETRLFQRATTDFTRSFAIFSRGLGKSVIKSGNFWGIIVILPFFMLLIDFLIWGFFSIGLNNHDLQALNTSILSAILNWIISTPLIIMSLMIFPQYLFSARESNLLKRYNTIGLTKEQTFLSYMIASIAILIFIDIILLGPLMYVVFLFTELIHETDHNSPYVLFENMDLEFILVYLLGLVAVISFGYGMGMKSRSSKTLAGKATGLWILSMFSAGFLSMDFDLTGIFDSELGDVSSVIVFVIASIAKFMFVLSPSSWVNAGLIITANSQLLSVIHNGSAYRDFIVYGSISMSVFVSVWIAFRVNKISNFEAGR